MIDSRNPVHMYRAFLVIMWLLIAVALTQVALFVWWMRPHANAHYWAATCPIYPIVWASWWIRWCWSNYSFHKSQADKGKAANDA